MSNIWALLTNVQHNLGNSAPLTEKQNSCLLSGRLWEVVAMRELTVVLSNWSGGLCTTIASCVPIAPSLL